MASAKKSNKTRVMVVSGFLGSGKTTSMLALSEYIKGNKGCASIITNDLGANLVDTNLSVKSGLSITEIPSGCICYQMDNVVDKLRGIRDRDSPDIIMSDIPGCGVGALDHVYHKLNKDNKDEFILAPFTVITDPERLRMIMPENADLNLPEELKYLLTTQLDEADLIVLNKTDLLSSGEVKEYVDFLESSYPDADVITISAKTGDGLDVFSSKVLSQTSKLKVVELDQDKFVAAESLLSWYNRRFTADTKDGSDLCMNGFIEDLMENVRTKLKKKKGNVPHLKTFASSDDDYCKVSLIGVDYDLEYARKFSSKHSSVRVIVNARAAIDSKKLSKIMDKALSKAARKHDLDVNVFFTESFGVMDPA